MPVMSRTVHNVCRAMFVATFLVFLALATALVATQLVGVVAMQPELVTWAADHLLVPSITAGVVFGLVGFVGGYLMPSGEGDEG